MNVQRGDVVLVDYPYAGGGGTKVRPVLVVQNDRDNQRLLNTIVVQITGTTQRAIELTQVFVKLTSPEGQQSGLRQDSVVPSSSLATLPSALHVLCCCRMNREMSLSRDRNSLT